MKIKRNWKHMIQKTQDKYMLENIKGAIKQDNPENMAA
jgi:hypothetical protein